MIETCSIITKTVLTTKINEYSVAKKFPFVFVADEAFTLKAFMLRPFPRKRTLTFMSLLSIMDCLVQDGLLKTPSGY